MKKLLGIFFIAAILLTAGAAGVALAQEEPPEGFALPTTEQIPATGGDLIGRIGLIGNWVFAIFLALSLIYIVLAAFQFVTGGGKPEDITAARQKLIYAVIGIAIALLAAGFDDILRSILVT